MIEAVVPLMRPPTTVPAPGINFITFETMYLPAKVAPPVPPIAATRLAIVALSIEIPKIAVI